MSDYITETASNISITEETDVIVCCGGPAGVAAALAAKTSRFPDELDWQAIAEAKSMGV